MQQQVTLQAKHQHTIFHNEQNGYTVAKFVTYDDNEEDFTVTGFFIDLEEDVIYELNGDYVEHSRYGMQFQVASYDKMMPNDINSLIRYFSSGLFPGIGKQTAIAIVDDLGEDAISLIKEDPSILNRISTLNDKKRESIRQGVCEHDEEDETTRFLTQHGISIKLIKKMQAMYGEEAVAVVKENPYRMIEEIDGIGFKTADKLAKELSFDDNHPYRMKAIVLSSLLDACMASGDTYVEEQTLINTIAKRCDFDYDYEASIEELVQDRLMMIEDGRFYHHTQYDAEKGIATFMAMFPYEETLDEVPAELEQDIQKLEQKYHIEYEKKQRNAMFSFFEKPFSIITGGPGTGKTTIVQGILSLYRQYYPNDQIACCAPTGRASKRLAELSNGPATTIHSLLKWDLESNTFLANDKDPIQADLLIVDEFSMVDQWLFYNLVKAGKGIKKILLIGDEDQLPSVGPGCVLKDMIECEQFSVSRLEKIFRQKEGSDVVTLAHEIREGHISIFDKAKDIGFFPCKNYEVKDLILSVVRNALEKGYEEKDVQILAPMYGGVAGIDALNIALQKMMNPGDSYKREIKIGYRIYREQDKVLQLKNQPEDDVFNGDIGKITEIIYAGEDINKRNRIIVDFEGTMVEYSGEQIYHITHAYCISIHKSQGSEYPIVIMPVVSDYSYMLQKRLLYTGVTRAKKSLVLLGSREIFERSIQVEERHQRKSTLLMRLSNFSA